MRHLLVVANETVTGGGLIDAVKRKAKEQDVELVTVLAPVSTPETGYVVYEDTRRADSEWIDGVRPSTKPQPACLPWSTISAETLAGAT